MKRASGREREPFSRLVEQQAGCDRKVRTARVGGAERGFQGPVSDAAGAQPPVIFQVQPHSVHSELSRTIGADSALSVRGPNWRP
jgi:hypothetical protein